jgi:hypothetical protein
LKKILIPEIRLMSEAGNVLADGRTHVNFEIASTSNVVGKTVVTREN